VDVDTLDIRPLERVRGLVDPGGSFDLECVVQLPIEVPWPLSHDYVPTKWVTGQ